MTTLGIDPGVTGAAVLLDRYGNFDACWHWKPGRIDSSEGLNMPAPTLGHAMELLAAEAHGVDTVCLEGMYVPRDRKMHPTFLTLMEATGRAIGACETAGIAARYRPMASTWRAKVMPATIGKRRKAAEAYELAHIHERIHLPEPWNTNIHVVEAAMIALYGHHQALHDAKKRAG